MKLLQLIFFITWANLAWTQKLPFDFEAKGLLILSDADMVASAYIDGVLNTDPKVVDALTVVQWDTLASGIHCQELQVPNSVTNWVNGMDITEDGQTAFVIDTKGSLPRSMQKVKNVFEDLPNGNMLYAIDLSDLQRPVLLDQIRVGQNPLSVDVNPQTGELLVVNREKGNEINMVTWEGQQFGEIRSEALSGEERVATHGSWHPSGNYFGLTLEPTMEVAFYEVSATAIAPFGVAVKAGSYPGAASFSKNGRYYLVPDLKWDQSYATKGALIAVKFAPDGQHTLTSTVEVGISPEGFAISPNGKLIAVSNMGTNFMPMDFPLFGQKASITLLAFDEE
ncbi:MAG: hypothetical protein AAGD05_11505, partial [Bacteroidota bacterium]